MNRRQCLRCMAAGIGLAMAPWPGANAAARSWTGIPKTLWVWRTPLSASDRVVETARRLNVRKVYYSIPPAERAGLLSENSGIAGHIRAFRDAGIGFHAVSGDPAWCRHGGRLPVAVSGLLDYQARDGSFDGLCLDIEPQALPEWRTDARRDIARGYLELLDTIAKASRAARLALTVSVVPAFANLRPTGNKTRTVLETAATRADEIVLMAYRDSPRTALRIADRSLRQLDAAGKPWWFGVSTHVGAKKGVSFAGATQADFATALASMDDALTRRGGLYRGIAINDYPSLDAIVTNH